MRREFLKVALLAAAAVALASEAAHAKLNLPVIDNYGTAGDAELWKSVGKGDIPASLVQRATMANPSKAMQAPYDKVFLQNDRFVVCYGECAAAQPVSISRDQAKDDYVVNSTATAGLLARPSSLAALKTANVYYWVNRLMDELQSVNFRPARRIVVRVDRDVVDPSGGTAMTNNAFFNPKDWTLSFLPVRAKRGLMATQVTLTSPALDPSVAMHETMHSVFEQAIGPILNREIGGLHEAFADYFALDVLNDHRLGVVFAAGTPVRRADVILKYKTGMPSHDLGNVVAAALWKIRGQIADRVKSRSLAFRTIETLARSPYIGAGDVARIHLALAKQMQLSASVVGEIEKTWAETGLTPSPIDAHRVTAPTQFTPAPRIAVTVSSNVPDSVMAQWGLPKENMSRLSIFGTAAADDIPGTMWLHTGVEQKDQPVRSIRILLNSRTASILAAFDRAGRLIEPADQAPFNDLKTLSEGLPDVVKWLSGTHQPMVDLMNGQGEMAKMLKAQDLKVEPMSIQINGRPVPALRHSFNVRPQFWARALLTMLDRDMAQQLSSIDAIAIYSADLTQMPNLQAFPKVAEGRHLVGISIRTASGVVQTSILSGFEMPNQTVGAWNLMR